jgi:hypothetical protein
LPLIFLPASYPCGSIEPPFFRAPDALAVDNRGCRARLENHFLSEPVGTPLDPQSRGIAQEVVMHANQRPVRSDKKAAWRWVPPAEQAAVRGYDVGGMLYIGTSMPFKPLALSAEELPAPFLINADLPISDDENARDYVEDFVVQDYIDSHPAYDLMKPGERKEYLTWLDGGRRNPRARAGFPLLFLYGLEHRVMVERPNKSELAEILDELKELRAVYGARHEFLFQSTALIHETEWKLLRDNGPALAAYRPELLDSDVSMPLVLRICVGRMVRGSAPIPFDWAMGTILHVVSDNGGFRKRIGYTKAKREFLDLARIRFAANMPDPGIRIRDQKGSRLRHQYNAACRYFTGYQGVERSLTPDSIPDAQRLTWTRMGKLCDAVIDELTPYAKALGVDNKNAGSLAALAALPADLHDQPYAAKIQTLKTWLADLPVEPRDTNALEIASWAGQSYEDCLLVPGIHRMVSDLLAVLGWGMEPDPLSTPLRTRHDDRFIIFPKLEGHALREPPSQGWDGAVAVICVLSELARNEGPSIHSDEISAEFGLRPLEAYRLSVLSRCLVERRVPHGELKKLAKSVAREQVPTIARALCAQAVRFDLGGFNRMRLLELIFDALSLPRGDLYGGLHSAKWSHSRHATSAVPMDLAEFQRVAVVEILSVSADPVLVEQASGRAGFCIPPPPPGATTRRVRASVLAPLQAFAAPPLELAPIDMAAVARIEAETAVVSTLLAAIYEDDVPVHVAAAPEPVVVASPEPEASVIHAAAPATAPAAGVAEPGALIEGLDAEHGQFLTALCHRETWSRAEFEALASSLGLMADGAAEVVNDWAWERFDDAIIEDGDPLTINIALMR